MIQSPQQDGIRHEATVSWRFDGRDWVVAIESSEFDPVEATANDAFEALGLVRAELEPGGWRLGVAGAQIDVWPSGMARDQGGGQVAHKWTAKGAEFIVDTFEPVDPTTVTTVPVQTAQAHWRLDEWDRKSQTRPLREFFDISDAIVVFLTNYPGKNETEFRARFDGERARTAVREILGETIKIRIEWGHKTLSEIGDEIVIVMHERHPELSDAALQSLANYYTYNVK